jgi:isopentenyl-diphosphate Delta-isomerase
LDMLQESKNNTHKQRKTEQLNISLNENVQFKDVSTGFEDYYFIHQALPEINLAEIDLSINLLGKHLSAPIIISSMVGGIEKAGQINSNLAKAAQALGLAMGVGSQRCLLDSPEMAQTYRVRDIGPDILLFANLGAVQLNYGFGVRECSALVKSIGADALILHLNPLQEALQPDGNTNFKGLLKKIRQVCRELSVPVVIKEVGWGISEDTALKLAEAGAAAIDIAGSGGTCWSEIERRRVKTELDNRVASAFSSWGIQTAESIVMSRKAAPELPLIASGGIRSGLDIAKAIALGADAAGIALPLLKAACNSAEEAQQALKEMIEVLKTAMFCIGAGNIAALKNSAYLKKR